MHARARIGIDLLFQSIEDQPESEAAIREEEEWLAEVAVSEAFVIHRLKAKGARVGIVVLDACHDNPLRAAEAQNPFRSTKPGASAARNRDASNWLGVSCREKAESASRGC